MISLYVNNNYAIFAVFSSHNDIKSHCHHLVKLTIRYIMAILYIFFVEKSNKKSRPQYNNFLLLAGK